MSIKQSLARKILLWNGWQIENSVQLPPKCVICLAPHTSNWDFIYAVLFKWAVGIKASFFMKKEWFFFPMKYIMSALGGIPVDRSKRTKLTDQIADEFNRRESLYLAVTPEGTRSYTTNWKCGFYFIAQKAHIPILLAFIDFQAKRIGFGKFYEIVGNLDDDMQNIKNFYKGIQGKHPEKFGI